MPPLRLFLVAALVLGLVGSAAAAAAVDPAEWDSAVEALQDADPTIEPLSPDPDSLTVVGGTSTGPTMAVAARRRLDQVTGRMTLVVGSGTTLKATVVCVAAVTLPDGGGYATVVGELDQPTATSSFLVFRITDSAQPGGAGDMWDQQTQASVPACVAEPGTTLITAGNVVVDPGA